jgi:hypothetical protein
MGSVLAILALLSSASTAAPAADSRYRHIDHPPDAPAQLAEMVELYDQLCLRAFPSDEAIARAMADRGAMQLTRDQVRIFLHDDPGLGWHLAGRTAPFEITIEAPPYHACTVRTMTAKGFPDMSAYRRLADAFEAGKGFVKMAPGEHEAEGLHSWMWGEMLRDDSGGTEALLVVTGIPTAEHRAHGEDSAEVRFVHQRAVPGAR